MSMEFLSPYDAVSLDVAGLCAILLAMVREREREVCGIRESIYFSPPDNFLFNPARAFRESRGKHIKMKLLYDFMASWLLCKD